MGFGDQIAAAEFRDVMERIAEGVVNRLRPDTLVGKVFNINRAEQKAYILLPGEDVDNLLVARFALDKVPTKLAASTYATDGIAAPGDVVRLGGKPGAYYILDFVSGAPEGIGGPGDGGTSADTQIFLFPIAATVWTGAHTFGTQFVRVTTYDEFGTEIDGDVTVVDETTVQVVWSNPESGSMMVED